MKRITKGLLLGGALAAFSFQADAKQNGTFIAARSVLENLGMEKPLFHSRINKRIYQNEDNFGATVQAVGFYQGTTNDEDLGEYFGINGKRTLTILGSTATGKTYDIDRKNLFRKLAGAANDFNTPAQADSLGLAGTLGLTFERSVGGVRFDYNQELECLFKGLYFRLSTAVVDETTKSSIGLTNSQTQTVDNGTGAGNGLAKSATDYFAGNVLQTAGINQQATLNNAKIGLKRHKLALADIDLKLGWNFLESRKYNLGFNLDVLFPTGVVPKMEVMFEPTGGSTRGHWAIGAGLDGTACLWNKNHQMLQFLANAQWKYLFKDTEKRTFDISGNPWSRYMQVGTTGVLGVQPLANVSTLDTKVSPGNQVNALGMLSYINSGFVIDLGYDFFYKEAEQIEQADISGFNANTYGFAGNDYAGTGAFAQANIPTANPTIGVGPAGGATGAWLSVANLDRTGAASPSQLTHTILAGVGYTFEGWRAPLFMGINGSYEFAKKKEDINQWSIGGRLGVNF